MVGSAGEYLAEHWSSKRYRLESEIMHCERALGKLRKELDEYQASPVPDPQLALNWLVRISSAGRHSRCRCPKCLGPCPEAADAGVASGGPRRYLEIFNNEFAINPTFLLWAGALVASEDDPAGFTFARGLPQLYDVVHASPIETRATLEVRKGDALLPSPDEAVAAKAVGFGWELFEVLPGDIGPGPMIALVSSCASAEPAEAPAPTLTEMPKN